MLTYKVRIKPGCEYGAQGQHPAGSVLLVSEAEVRSFGDKFTLLETLDVEPEPQPDPVPEAARSIEAQAAAVVAHLERVFGAEVAEEADPATIASLQARMRSGEVPHVAEVIGPALARKLAEAGYDDAITVFYATDGDLQAINGVGPGTLRRLREVYGKAGD